MAQGLLNTGNITVKEHVILAILDLTTSRHGLRGISAQGLANVQAGRVGGSVGSTRRALKVMVEMGYVTYFSIGRTKFWHITQLGYNHLSQSMHIATLGHVCDKPEVMF